MGVSPFYRGTDCNFWAIYDNNPQLVGATIHLLEKGVDNGKILYHAFPKIVSNPFDFSMLSVKAAIDSVIFNLKNNNFSKFKPISQDKVNEIRYSKKDEFNDEIIKNFFNRKIRFPLKENYLMRILLNLFLKIIFIMKTLTINLIILTIMLGLFEIIFGQWFFKWHFHNNIIDYVSCKKFSYLLVLLS